MTDSPPVHAHPADVAADPELWSAIADEHQRQEAHIELIASENYTSRAVMAAQGSQLTNKYAEGYPGRRYYGGCEHVERVEQLALERVKRLFGADAHGWAANVQAHSGAQANAAVFLAFLKPGDTFMGMNLAEGGHLSHGMALNMSGKWFNVVSYGLNAAEEIDYEAMERKARETRPKLIIAGASAYSLRIVSGRTESHVMLVDLRPKGLTGKAAEALLGRAHITVNKNAIPNDPEKPMVTSGVRLGSPAMTTRGFKEEQAGQVGHLIADLLDAPEDAARIEDVKARVAVLTAAFPVYR